MSQHTDKRERTEPGIWQEVEFGSYDADLPLWRELVRATDGPVLELGAGAGRVTLGIAGGYSTEGGYEGSEVIAVEKDSVLTAELKPEAERMFRAIRFVEADLTSPETLRLPSRPTLAIGPLHVIQELDGAARRGLLSRLREVMAPGGTIALTLVDERTLLSAGTDSAQILPDMREFDGWVYSSEPLWVQVGDDLLTVRRLRERVSPEGRMERSVHDDVLHRVSPESLEREAEEAGLHPAGRRQISSGPNEADSTVVLLEVPS
jgi:SAM-dependent methyltransferase